MNSQPEHTAYTDIKKSGRLLKTLPASMQPYALLMRLDRPIGWWLLLLPGWWAIVLASGGVMNMDIRSWALMAAFLIGAVVMRGAGCVVNDLWDRDLDKMVERTRERPLASGAVSIKQAAAFLILLLMIGAAILLSMNMLTIMLGLLSLPLIALYPAMKRITYWPQLFLGLTFNFGALMGWAAVTGELSAAPLFLYLGGIFWTIGYDTIYAHQDKEDDALAGIKSTALKFGDRSKLWVSGFYLGAFMCFAASIFLVGHVTVLNVLALILPAAHLIWQLVAWQPQGQENSLIIFKSNRMFGVILLLILSYI